MICLERAFYPGTDLEGARGRRRTAFRPCHYLAIRLVFSVILLCWCPLRCLRNGVVGIILAGSESPSWMTLSSSTNLQGRRCPMDIEVLPTRAASEQLIAR